MPHYCGCRSIRLALLLPWSTPIRLVHRALVYRGNGTLGVLHPSGQRPSIVARSHFRYRVCKPREVQPALLLRRIPLSGSCWNPWGLGLSGKLTRHRYHHDLRSLPALRFSHRCSSLIGRSEAAVDEGLPEIKIAFVVQISISGNPTLAGQLIVENATSVDPLVEQNAIAATSRLRTMAASAPTSSG